MADALVSHLIHSRGSTLSRRELIHGIGTVVVGGALLAIGRDPLMTAPVLPAPVAQLRRSPVTSVTLFASSSPHPVS